MPPLESSLLSFSSSSSIEPCQLSQCSSERTLLRAIPLCLHPLFLSQTRSGADIDNHTSHDLSLSYLQANYSVCALVNGILRHPLDRLISRLVKNLCQGFWFSQRPNDTT